LNLCINEYPNSDAAAIGEYTLGNIYWNDGKKKSTNEPYTKYLERFPKDKTILYRLKKIETEK
jgi:TolA-binding protein